MRYPALTILTVIFVSVSLATGVSAQGKKAAAKQPPAPTPTEAAVSYGPHSKQVLSFWKWNRKSRRHYCSFMVAGGRPEIAWAA